MSIKAFGNGPTNGSTDTTMAKTFGQLCHMSWSTSEMPDCKTARVFTGGVTLFMVLEHGFILKYPLKKLENTWKHRNCDCLRIPHAEPPGTNELLAVRDFMKEKLMVLTILKKINQWEGLSHILWKIRNVPNHQPVIHSSVGFVRNCPRKHNSIVVMFLLNKSHWGMSHSQRNPWTHESFGHFHGENDDKPVGVWGYSN